MNNNVVPRQSIPKSKTFYNILLTSDKIERTEKFQNFNKNILNLIQEQARAFKQQQKNTNYLKWFLLTWNRVCI